MAFEAAALPRLYKPLVPILNNSSVSKPLPACDFIISSSFLLAFFCLLFNFCSLIASLMNKSNESGLISFSPYFLI